MDTTRALECSSSFSFASELLIGNLEKITGDDIRLAQILAEKIPEDDLDPAAQSQDGDQQLTPEVAQRIDFYAYSPGAIAPGRAYDYTAVATALIIDHIVWTHFGHGQHLIYFTHGRGHPGSTTRLRP